MLLIFIIKKTKNTFSFPQKILLRKTEFLSENLIAKAKLKKYESQECFEKFAEKKS